MNHQQRTLKRRIQIQILLSFDLCKPPTPKTPPDLMDRQPPPAPWYYSSHLLPWNFPPKLLNSGKSNWQCKSYFQNDLDIMQCVHAIKLKLVRTHAVLTENYEPLGFRSVAWNLTPLTVFFYLFLNSKFYCTPGLRKVLEINILSPWVILINT